MNSPLVVGLGLLVGGLIVVALARYMWPAVMVTVVRVIGIVLALIGVLVLVLQPLTWLARQLSDAMGVK